MRRSLRGQRDEAAFREMHIMLRQLQGWEDQGKLDLYYFDEAGFSQTPPLPSAWSPVGQRLELSAYSHSRRLNVLGLLSRRGRLVYRSTTDTVTTDVVIDMFEHWIAHKPGDRCVVVVMDNARIHRSAQFTKQLSTWAKQHVYVVYLPPYSPELNLIELLWKKVKYEWLPCSAYSSFEKLCQQVRQTLSGYGSEYKITFV
jgi:transposase